MEDNLVYTAFAALPPVALLGIYLFFVKYRQHENKNPPWWKLVLGNLLVFLFCGSCALLLGETYYRSWYDTTDTFGMTKVSERWFQRYYQMNNVGTRDNCEYALAPPLGRRRITFVGDSFTAGQGIPNVEDRFANRLRHKYPAWEVHVLAQNGFGTGDELTVLKKCVERGYKLDCVVLVYCLNDIDDLIPEWMDRIRKFNERGGAEQLGFLFQHSYLLDTLYFHWWAVASPELRDYFPIEHKAYFDASWQRQTVRLKAMRDLVRNQSGALCVVTFPYPSLLGPSYNFRDVHRRLDELWRSMGIAHLDLLSVYEPYGPRRLCVNASDAHPNECAHALAADALAPFLQTLLEPTSRNNPPASAMPK
jgi:hypothetical protein